MSPLCEDYDVLMFDLDGTLSDPLQGAGNCINYALSHYGYELRPLSELAQFVGPPLDQTFLALTGVSRQSEIEALVAKYRERYAQIGFSENILYPGVRTALTMLSQSGITMGICTSKRADFAERILKMFDLLDLFEFIDGGDIGISKTQQVARLKECCIVTSASLMVGDRAIDIRAAHENDLQAAGVLWGYGSSTELEEESPRYLFSSPAEWSLLG